MSECDAAGLILQSAINWTVLCVKPPATQLNESPKGIFKTYIVSAGGGVAGGGGVIAGSGSGIAGGGVGGSGVGWGRGSVGRLRGTIAGGGSAVAGGGSTVAGGGGAVARVRCVGAEQVQTEEVDGNWNKSTDS
jgi:hypothetical protein